MAITAPCVTRHGGLRLLSNINDQYFKNVSRHLYSPQTLLIDKYVKQRDSVKSSLWNLEEFRQKMTKVIAGTDQSRISINNSKNMVYIAKKTPEDLNLLIQLIRKCYMTETMHPSMAVNGTEVMRAFYYLNEPQIALETFKNPELQSFFDNLTTYQILLDLLFNNAMYAEVREVYDILNKKKVKSQSALMIVVAACYKQNTENSLDYAWNICANLNQVQNVKLPEKVILYLCTLALNQNDPKFAQELFALSRSREKVVGKNVDLLINNELQNFDDVLNILREFRNMGKRRVIFKDVFSKTFEAVKKDVNFSAQNILNELRAANIVNPKTLDEWLCQPIIFEKKNVADRLTLQLGQDSLSL